MGEILNFYRTIKCALGFHSVNVRVMDISDQWLMAECAHCGKILGVEPTQGHPQ